MTFREEIIGDARLILGDCREVLPTLGKVDAVVTDPPYGIGWDRQALRDTDRKPGVSLARKGAYEATGWDDEPAAADLIEAIRAMSRTQIIFGGNFFALPPSRCWLVWDKQTGDNQFADCELAWTNLEKPARRIVWMWNGMLRKNGEERNGHPTQKPLSVMSWALSQLPPTARTVLDPFAGSGTTGVACAKAGLQFTGIEREPKYFDIACRRINEAYKQPRLFAEPVAKPTQLALLEPSP